MEPDRYQQNKFLFILGMACLVLSIGLFLFSMYLLPYLIWNWYYDLPEFISTLNHWLVEQKGLQDSTASWAVFLIFFIPALLLGIIADIASNRIDNKVCGIKPEEIATAPGPEKKWGESTKLGLKIMYLIILVIVAIAVLQWIISTPIT